MPKIQVVEAGSMPWMTQDEDGPDGERRLIEIPEPDDERSAARHPHPGSDTQLYLHEAQLPPNKQVASHAHRSDEIIYILDGEIHLGARVLGPGSSVFVPGMTLYAFRAGPKGVRFLNFRGRKDTTHLTKEEFLAERRGS